MNEEENIERMNEPSDEQLINYLEGNLSGKESHAVEESMMNSDFVNDAVEGLQSFAQDKKLDEYVQQLNKNLHQQLAAKKQRKEKRKIKGMEWVMLAAVIVLAICLVAYVVIRML